MGATRRSRGPGDNQNPSLGEATPNSFKSGTWISTELTTNLDFKRGFDIGLQKPLDLSYGFEHRRDGYEVKGGGLGVPMPTGMVTALPLATAPLPGPRSPTASPRDEASSASRNSLASYVDVGFNPFRIGTWARHCAYEHYNEGVGATRSGKLTTRYDFTPQFAVRATVSKGFRAPSLANSLFSARSTHLTVWWMASISRSITACCRWARAAARALGAGEPQARAVHQLQPRILPDTHPSA